MSAQNDIAWAFSLLILVQKRLELYPDFEAGNKAWEALDKAINEIQAYIPGVL